MAKIYTSEEVLAMEDLYDLQDTFSSSGIPFQYKMTEGEIGWAKFIRNKYLIADWVWDNLDETGVLTFHCSSELRGVLEGDGMFPKAVMLSDETALQRLFFWLS